MGKTETLKIVITSDSKGAITGIDKFSDATEEMGNVAKNSGAKLGLLDGAMIAAGGMAVNMGMDLLKSIPQLIDLGIEADRASLALEGYAGSSDEAARYTEAVQVAAGGAISKMDAMQNASRLLSMGLANSTDEAAKLTEMATTLGASMGKGPKQAFEDFSLMLANTSIPRLDTFGISASQVRERMAELQTETEGLDRQTAFLIATMEVGGDALTKLKDAGFEASNSLDRLKATTEDLKVEFGQRLAPVALAVADDILRAFKEMDEQNVKLSQTVAKTTGSYEEFKKTQLSLGHQFWTAVVPAYDEYIYKNEYLKGAVELGKITMDGWSASLFDNAVAVEGADGAIADYSDRLSELQGLISGRLGPEMERFEEKNIDLRGAVIELEQEIARLEGQKYLTTEQSQQLVEARTKLGEAKGAVEELATAHEDATKRILFALMSQRLGIDGVTETEFAFLQEAAEQFGIIDEATLKFVQGFEDVATELDLANIEGAQEKFKNLTEEMGIAGTTATTETGIMNAGFKTLADEGLLNARQEAELLTKRIIEMPSQKVIDIYVRTIYSSYGSPSGYGNVRQNLPQGYQHGGSFMVGGPSGVDKTPVSFMATRGERVTITPKGGKGGGTTINLTYAPAFSLGDREEMETQFIPFLDEALRRAGLSQ